MQISTGWDSVKTLATNNTWIKYYIDHTDNLSPSYIIIVGNKINQYYTRVHGINQKDFEDTHKSSALKIKSFNEAVAKLI